MCHKTKPSQTKAIIYTNIYMYKEDLVLNNVQWLMSHKIKTNQVIYI